MLDLLRAHLALSHVSQPTGNGSEAALLHLDRKGFHHTVLHELGELPKERSHVLEDGDVHIAEVERPAEQTVDSMTS